MDQDRQIRFAIPPFFLFASLLWGAYLAHRDLSLILKPENAKEVFGVLAAAAVAVIPVGFLIGTVSVSLLRIIALVAFTPTYEAVLKDTTLERIWGQLNTTQPKDAKFTLYAATTFDHELLSPGVHTWLMRRWNSFNVASNSIVALLLAHVTALIFAIPQVCGWWLSTLVMVGLLFFIALNARNETMEMIEFQSYRQQKSDAKKDGA